MGGGAEKSFASTAAGDITTPKDKEEDVSLTDLKKRMADFAKERDWDQFHSPRNLLLALVKSSDLALCFLFSLSYARVHMIQLI